MKKLLLAMIALVLSATGQAQPARKLVPMKAGKSDIILTQPEGELRTYNRTSGGCCDVIYGSLFADDLKQEGSVRVVFAPDGKTVYIQNIISRAASGAWVKGTIEDGKLLIPYGQKVYWFENPTNPSTKEPEEPYGLMLAEVSMKGAHTSYTVKTTGNAVFRLENDGQRMVMEGCTVDLEAKNITGLGLVYTDAHEGEWSYYMDYETVFTEVEEKPVTPPEGLVTERYSIGHGIYGHFVEVGFARGDVYIRAISQDYVPSAWIKGTLNEETNEIYFPAQLAGSYQVYLFYFLGADMTKLNDNYGGTYSYNLNPEEMGITFNYDPETRSFSSDRALVVNNGKDSLDRFERFPKPVFRPYTERAATPAAPAVMELNDSYWAYGYSLSTLAISVPCFDEDGNFLDPTKLFYALYVDDDEPYLLYQDEYEGLPFDAVEEIPYLFTNNKDIFPRSLGMNIYQNGFERMGIKSIYYGGDERHETDIYYTKPVSGVSDLMVDTKAASQPIYDLTGRQVKNPTKGLYIINGKKVLK